MLTYGSILVSLLWLVEQIPTPPPPAKRQRGRQETYSDKLFVKALIVMIIRRLSTAYALLHFLDQDDPVALQLRPLLTEHGRFPTRRTWERRFETLPARLPALIGCLGRHLVELLQPWVVQGHAAAVDSTPLRANGGVWHKRHRLAGEVPHTSIDTEAAWSKSGYHGWWYGWKLHLAVVVGSVWIPLAAEFPIASDADNVIAPKLLEQLPLAVRYVLGDTHYNTLSCARNVRCITGNWSPHAVVRIPIGMGASTSDGSFISYVHWPSSRSTASSKTSLNGVARCRSKA